MVAKALDVRVSLRSDQSPEGQGLLARIRQLVTEARLLGVSGYVSQPNVSVLVSALDEVGHLLVSAQRSSLSDMHVLAHDDLVPPIVSERRAYASRPTRGTIKDSLPSKGHTEAAAPGNRGERILATLRSGDLLGIKDISVGLPEYSEKMIQRELADLVASGRVRKVGAKRWSRYGFVR